MVHETIPSTDVVMADIRDTLNANGGNVTNVLGTFFGDSAKINKWAKFKPIKYASLKPLTETQIKSVNYGLTAPQHGSIEETKTRMWTYNRPTGGTSSPYRLSDFCGYTTVGTGPVSKRTDLTFNLMFNEELIIQAKIGVQNMNEIEIGELPALSEYYFCVVLTDGSNVMWKTSTGKISSSSQIRIAASELTTGKTYGYYICACDTQRTSLTSALPANPNFLTLPCNLISDMSATITTVSRFLGMTITGVATLNNNVAPTASTKFFDPEPFMRPLIDSELENLFYYLNVKTYYNLTLQFTMKNNTSETAHLYKSKFWFKYRNNFATGTHNNKYLVTNMYELVNGAYVKTDSAGAITFYAGERKTVVIELGNNLLRANDSGLVARPTEKLLNLMIEFYYPTSNTNTASAGLNLRVTNK